MCSPLFPVQPKCLLGAEPYCKLTLVSLILLRPCTNCSHLPGAPSAPAPYPVFMRDNDPTLAGTVQTHNPSKEFH
jgi:hypothetical protein